MWDSTIAQTVRGGCRKATNLSALINGRKMNKLGAKNKKVN